MSSFLHFNGKNDNLYHKDVFMPESYNVVAKKLQSNMKGNVYLSKHVIENMGKDKSHDYTLENVVKVANNLRHNPADSFEIGTQNLIVPGRNNKQRITKYVVRVPYDQTRDISIVMRPSFNELGHRKHWFNTVATAWLNDRNDTHKTLGKAGIKYVTKENHIKVLKGGI